MRWRRGRVCGGGGHMMAATFQSIWINSHWALRRRRNTPSPWKRYEHLAEFKAAPVSQSGRRAGRQAVTAEREILKQPVATKGVFSCGGAHRRMRSRCDPAQLPAASKPHRDPAGCVFQCFFFFFFLERGEKTPSCDFLRWEKKASGEEYVLYRLVMDFLKGIAGFAGRHML